MAEALFTPRARADLNDIWDFTSEQWGPAQADSYVTEIVRVCQDLAAGRLASREASMVREGYLIRRTAAHVVFFRHVAGEEGGIEIIRFLHERMDPSRHI